MSELKVQTVKDFAKEKGFVQMVPTIRVNTNGYPFLTLINGNNEAENIYFSKSAAKNVTEGMKVTPELLKMHQIGHITNESGEARVKLISNSERVELASMFE